MSFYVGRPRPRALNHRGGHKVCCAVCGAGYSARNAMVYTHIDVPGYPRRRVLVHPECKDMPDPYKGGVPNPRPMAPPDIIQMLEHTDEWTHTTPTITSIISEASGANSATIAQLSNPNLILTGTMYNIRSVCLSGVEYRPTTYVSSTSLIMAVNADDIAAPGALSITVYNKPPPYAEDGVQQSSASTFTVLP